MLKSKSELEKYLVNQCEKVVFKKETCKEIQKYLFEEFHIPMGFTMDMISQRVVLKEQSDFLLFCLLKALSNNKKDNKINEFFTEIEIKEYSNAIYELDDLIKFPIVIKCCQVSSDQWIGKTDVNFLMGLRKAQMINYNANAQRVMTKVIKGDKEYYKISLNKKAVSEIKKSFNQGNYISNTITLNIPADSDTDFYYDEDKCELVINNIKSFDITDGFHRLIGMAQEKDENPDFNYPMELRVVNFTDDKAKQMIYQEDKKTQMRKIDSKSMNMNLASNIVCERLNQDTMFNLKGSISRNDGIISFSELSVLVDYFYFKGTSKAEENSIRIKATKDIRNKFNYLTECYDIYLNRKYTYKDLAIILFVFNYTDDLNKMSELINKTIEISSTIDNKKFSSKVPKKSLMNDIESIVKEIENNVQ